MRVVRTLLTGCWPLQVEVKMALLWECALDSEENVKTRMAALAMLREHKTKVEDWIQARKQRSDDSE